MIRRKDLLLEYLNGKLSIEEARLGAGSGKNRRAVQLLRLAELDDSCRSLAARVEAPPGAADRLAELVSSPQAYVREEGSEGRKRRPLLGIGSLYFDVVGAQLTPKEDEKKAGKRPRKRKKSAATGKKPRARRKPEP
jgi:hypothetical protein